jgi:hypothetical protein
MHEGAPKPETPKEQVLAQVSRATLDRLLHDVANAQKSGEDLERTYALRMLKEQPELIKIIVAMGGGQPDGEFVRNIAVFYEALRLQAEAEKIRKEIEG